MQVKVLSWQLKSMVDFPVFLWILICVPKLTSRGFYVVLPQYDKNIKVIYKSGQ